MPRAFDRRQLPVDRDPLKQLDTNYGKLPKVQLPGEGLIRDAFRTTLKETLGIDFSDDKPFLTWFQERTFWTNLVAKADAARLLAQQRIRAGTNLVSDPGVDNPEFWDQVAIEQVDDSEVTPFEGNHALRMTSLGANPVYAFFNTDSDGNIDPIKVRRGDVFIVEARAFSPISNATGTVQLMGRMRNSRTGASQDTVIDFVSMTGAYRGQWQQLSGTVEIPAGYDEFSAGLLLPADETTATQKFYGDQFVIRETTDAKRLFSVLSRRGSNLLLDPGVEDPVFWNQTAAAQVGTDVVIPSSGDTALQVTSQGGNATTVYFNTAFNGQVEPIAVRLGEYFEVQARVYSPVTNSPGSVQLVAKLENSRSGQVLDQVLTSLVLDSESQGAWQTIVGYVRVPIGYNRLSVGLRLPAGQTTAGQPFFADELVLQETTSIKRLFDIAKLRSRRGSNLVTDPSIEDPEFWAGQDSVTVVGTDVVTPSSGDSALQIVSRGATATDAYFNTAFDGSIDPITARANEYYVVEARVYAPSTNTTGNVSLVARFENSRTGASSNVVITTKSFDSAARGAWQKMSGVVKVPSGFNRISAGLRLPAGQTTATQPFFADELVIREASASQRLTEISRLRIRRGSNLVTDPTFSDEEFWTQESTAVVDYLTVIPYSGNHSLQVTSRGATATTAFFNTREDGAVEPITVRRGETYEVAAYIYSPSANSNGVITLVARLANSRTGATTDVTVLTKSMTATFENQWLPVNGFVRIPAGYDQLSAGLVLPAGQTTSGDTYMVNEALIRESTAAKRLFDMSQLRTRHGTNLLADANFDDAEFWTQESAAQVDATVMTPRTGNYSLQITSRGATPTTVWFNTAYNGEVEPIRARLNERYFVECYAYSPAANAAATMKLVARLENSRTGATTDVVVDTQLFDTLTENVWQRLSGYVRITAGYNLISAGVMLDANQSTTGNTFFVDDALLRETTAAQRIIDTLFDGFNGSTGSFGKDPDDVFGVMDGVKDGVAALRLARQRAKVGPNFVNDPRIEDSSYWVQPGVTRSEAYYRNGGSSLEVTAGASPTYAWFNTIDGGDIQPIASWENDALLVQCWYFAPTQTGGGTAQLVVKAINSRTNAETETVLQTVTVQEAGAWKKLSATYVMPEGADSFSAGVKLAATGSTAYKTYFDALLIRESTQAFRLFNVSKLRTRAGNNLVTDSNFDDAEYWSAQESVAQVGAATVTPRTGSYSLQVTSRGATPTTAFFNTALDGTVEPIKTRFNEHFFVQCYVYSPAANSDGTIKLIARLSNAKTGASTDVVIDTQSFTSLTEGVWQELSGYVRITAGYNLISAGILLDANQTVTGNTFMVDDAVLREVTGSQRLVDALFDGFNGTSGTFGKDPTDVYGSMGVIGNGTTALSLARRRAAAGGNFVNDPRVEEFGYWTQTSSGRSSDYRRNGQYSLKITSRGATPTYVWWTTIDGGTVQPVSTWEDDCVHAQCWVYSPVQAGTGAIKLVARASNTFTGASVDTVLDTLTVTEGQWTRLSGIYTVPAGADALTVGVLIDTNAAPTGYTFYLDSLSIREAAAVQKLTDRIHQALTGESGTRKSDTDVDTGLRSVFAKLFDGLSNNAENTSTTKTGFQLYAAAKEARERAETGVSTAESANTFAGEIVESGSNLITNSDFESGLVSPQPLVGTYSSSQFYSGSRSLQMTGNSTTKTFYLLSNGLTPRTIPVTPGNKYLFEAYVYASGASGSVTDGLRLVIEPVARDNTALTDVYYGQTVSAALNGVWTKISSLVTLPPVNEASPLKTVAKMKVAVQLRSTVSSGTFWIDQVSLREVTVAEAVRDELETKARDFVNIAGGSDFEGDTHPWNLGTNWSIATDQFYAGTRSLKRTGGGGTTTSILQGTYATLPGEELYVSFYARRDSSMTATTTEQLVFINQAGATIGSVGFGANVVTSANTWTERTATVPIPAGTSSFTVWVSSAASAGNLWLDNISIKKVVPAATIPELPQSKITNLGTDLTATQTTATTSDAFAILASAANNLVLDPDFIDNKVRRESASFTSAYVSSPSLGTQSLRLTATNTAPKFSVLPVKPDGSRPRFPVSTGMILNFDWWVQAAAGNSTTQNMNIYVFLYNAAGQSFSIGVQATVVTAKGTWQRITGSYTVPATVAGGSVPFYADIVFGPTSCNVGEIFYLDRTLIYITT